MQCACVVWIGIFHSTVFASVCIFICVKCFVWFGFWDVKSCVCVCFCIDFCAFPAFWYLPTAEYSYSCMAQPFICMNNVFWFATLDAYMQSHARCLSISWMVPFLNELTQSKAKLMFQKVYTIMRVGNLVGILLWWKFLSFEFAHRKRQITFIVYDICKMNRRRWFQALSPQPCHWWKLIECFAVAVVVVVLF